MQTPTDCLCVWYRERLFLQSVHREGWENISHQTLHLHTSYTAASIVNLHKRTEYTEWEFLKLLFGGTFMKLIITHINLNLHTKRREVSRSMKRYFSPIGEDVWWKFFGKYMGYHCVALVQVSK